MSGVTVGTALLGGMVATTAATVYSANQQKKEAKKARELQEAQIQKAEVAQAEQDKMVAEQTSKEVSKTTERRRRASSGRKGLLYGSATGVKDTTSGTLGG